MSTETGTRADVRFAPDPTGLLDRVVHWAETDGDARALLLLGSRARAGQADVWSDTDLIVVVPDPAAFLADASWPARFGSVAVTFVERTPHGRSERRVLYVDGTDLDAVPVSIEETRTGLREPGPLSMLARGHRVLVDKDRLLNDLPAFIAKRGEEHDQPLSWPPGPGPFENLIADFWYHAVWSARKLRRGELWVARDCLDGYMKRLLLQVIEWRARASGDGGEARDQWFDGRFLEQWADPDTVRGLRDCFSHYDPDDLAHGLVASMDLFRQLATELAVRLELPYPSRADEAASRLVLELLEPVRLGG
jgi:aminoglycoside 6-adenylyltransferase